MFKARMVSQVKVISVKIHCSRKVKEAFALICLSYIVPCIVSRILFAKMIWYECHIVNKGLGFTSQNLQC